MEWLFKSFIILLSIDIIIVATIWYATQIIKPRFPNWWQRFIVDDSRNLQDF